MFVIYLFRLVLLPTWGAKFCGPRSIIDTTTKGWDVLGVLGWGVISLILLTQHILCCPGRTLTLGRHIRVSYKMFVWPLIILSTDCCRFYDRLILFLRGFVCFGQKWRFCHFTTLPLMRLSFDNQFARSVCLFIHFLIWLSAHVSVVCSLRVAACLWRVPIFK